MTDAELEAAARDVVRALGEHVGLAVPADVLSVVVAVVAKALREHIGRVDGLKVKAVD